MRILNKIFRFYVYGSLHTAFAVVAFSGVTLHVYAADVGISRVTNLLFFIFTGTVTGYNFIRFGSYLRQREKPKSAQLKTIAVFTLLCMVAFIYFATQMPWPVLASTALFGMLSLMYAIPLGSKSLRSITGIKILVIAIVWSGVTVIIPAQFIQIFSTDIAVELLQRLLFVIVLTLPFEIRDMRGDLRKITTIAHVLGTKNTRYAGLMLLFFVLVLDMLKTSPQPGHRLILVGVSLLTLMLLMRSTTTQRTYFASFWVEGIPILWLVLLLLFD